MTDVPAEPATDPWAQKSEGMVDLDVDARTVVVVGALVDDEVREHLLGIHPLDIDEDRFIDS